MSQATTQHVTTRHAATLELRSLSVCRGHREVLRELSLTAGAEVVGLLGAGGVAQSTLLKSIAGLLPPRSGQVLVNGDDVYDGSQRSAAASRVSLVSHELEVPGSFTVNEFLRHMAWMQDVPRHQVTGLVKSVLDAVDLLDQSDQPMRTLSVAMARRAAIAQALLPDPAVLLLDETLAGLDESQRVEICDLLRSLASSRCVVLASHALDDLDGLTSRLVVLHKGRLVVDRQA